jgi:hypothetical protein
MDTEEEIPAEETQEQPQEQEEQTGQVYANLFDSLVAVADDPETETEHSAGDAVVGSLVDTHIPAEQDASVEAESEPKKKVKRIHKKEVLDPIPAEYPEQEFTEQEELVDDTSFLLPEEKEQYEIVRHMAKKSGQGEDVQLLEFFRKQKEYIETRMSDDPDVDLRDDHEYQQFVSRNRPEISIQQVKAAEKEMLMSEAENRAIHRLRPEIQRQQIETHRIKLKPDVDAAKNTATQKVLSMIPEVIAEDLGSRSAEDVAKSRPYEFNIVNTAVTNASNLASEFIDIAKGMVDFNPTNGTHKQLRDWLVKEQDSFIQSGQTKDPNGRPFMRRERHKTLPPEQAQQYWTWTDEQCVDIMYARAKEAMDGALNEHAQAMQAYSQHPAPAPAPRAQHQPQSAPRAITPTPRQGGTSSPPPQASPTPLSLLGL